MEDCCASLAVPIEGLIEKAVPSLASTDSGFFSGKELHFSFSKGEKRCL